MAYLHAATQVLDAGLWQDVLNPSLPPKPVFLESPRFNEAEASRYSNCLYLKPTDDVSDDFFGTNRNLARDIDHFEVLIVHVNINESKRVQDNCRKICRDYVAGAIGGYSRCTFQASSSVGVLEEFQVILRGVMMLSMSGREV